MFDITSDEIAQLNDTDLRTLVGRLCEAELMRLGISASAVTWGGNQTAKDGGLDVRVALPPGAQIDGFIPRGITGFQVKKPDMPKAKIAEEMRPDGILRPVIKELADDKGAYVIVSASGSTADSALRTRRQAMRDSLLDAPNAHQLATDFYDRTRLATWVRGYPGLITWVKERIGKSFEGWHPYGPWCGTTESVDAEYFLDEKLRVDLGQSERETGQAVGEAIDHLRNELRQPGRMIRLVGLSGVGKTRFAQALFDARIGRNALPTSLAVYTNLNDHPNPQPTGLASDLLANGIRAVLVVDNCSSDLHRRLSEVCRGKDSTVSVITVEYDVRDDQPEGTQVVTLETSSLELITKILQQRYDHLSPVEARSISESSGGNARVAIAIAETVDRSDTVAGLSSDELFQRLFRQRQEPDPALLRAAQACALVYSFEGKTLKGEEAELPILAALVGQDPTETYRHVSELLRRGLAQQRADWRAILPHAIANRLASRALEEIPHELILSSLNRQGHERLLRSFSRRLSYLHDHPKAAEIVRTWLAPKGLLGNVPAFNALGHEIFQNIAPVLPMATLAALERAEKDSSAAAIHALQIQRHTLRSIAYEPKFFERCARLLAAAVTRAGNPTEGSETAETFASLFTLYLSGTHATIEQRLGVISDLCSAGEDGSRTLGLAALKQVLETDHFTSFHRFEFGARPRNYGYEPTDEKGIDHWYRSALSFVEHLYAINSPLKEKLRNLCADHFRGLWTFAGQCSNLERLARQFSADQFWRAGWLACRQTLYFDKKEMPPEISAQLEALLSDLAPANLVERVRGFVFGHQNAWIDFEEQTEKDFNAVMERRAEISKNLGSGVGKDPAAFAMLLPDFFKGGGTAWMFGRGLAISTPDARTCWKQLTGYLETTDAASVNIEVLRGFLFEIFEQNPNLIQTLLDEALHQPRLGPFLVDFHSATTLDDRGVERLEIATNDGSLPVSAFMSLALSGMTGRLTSSTLKRLLLLISDQPTGNDIAIHILFTRLHFDPHSKEGYPPELLETGRHLLSRLEFHKEDDRRDHEVGYVARSCLVGPDSEDLAIRIATRFKQASESYETYPFVNDELLSALLGAHPIAVLDTLLGNDDQESENSGVFLFERLGRHRHSPVHVIPFESLLVWCDHNREARYPIAAELISFSRRPGADTSLTWTDQAKTLLAQAPDPKKILEVFVRRLIPRSWTGSRATAMETNAKLLDEFESLTSINLTAEVNEAKTRLAQIVAAERAREAQEDSARNERFE